LGQRLHPSMQPVDSPSSIRPHLEGADGGSGLQTVTELSLACNTMICLRGQSAIVELCHGAVRRLSEMKLAESMATYLLLAWKSNNHEWFRTNNHQILTMENEWSSNKDQIITNYWRTNDHQIMIK